MRYKILFFEWKFHVKIPATTKVVKCKTPPATVIRLMAGKPLKQPLQRNQINEIK